MGKIKANNTKVGNESCAVPNCFNSSSSNITLHNFPRAKDVLLKWKTFCKIKHTEYVSKKFKVCSAHFTPDCFVFEQNLLDPVHVGDQTLLHNGNKS